MDNASSVTTYTQHLVKRVLPTLGAALFTAAVGIGSSGAAQAAALTSSNAQYNFTINDKYKGHATRQLTHSGNQWQYDVKASVAGIASANQHSQFTLVGNKVVPSKASTSYKIFGLGRTHRIRFNPSAHTVSSTYKGKTKTMRLPSHAFDDLSLEAQIRKDLLNGKFSGNYALVKRRSVEKTPFRNAGNQRISVPAGSFDTVRIDRVHSDANRRTSFWLAPSLDYLPVKVIQIDDGKKMELDLTAVR